jgi:hypothetical protein
MEHTQRLKHRREIREKYLAGVTLADLVKTYRFIRIRRILTKGR